MNKDIHPHLAPAGWLADALMNAILALANSATRLSFYNRAQPGLGKTLKPGAETPLWNELVGLLRPHVMSYGEQAKLARILGLPRQRVHSWLAAPTRLPDAERTLRLVLWLSTRPPIRQEKVSPNG